MRLVDVDARAVDRFRDPERVLEHVDDHLHDRAAEADRAGAPDDQPRTAFTARPSGDVIDDGTPK